MTPTHSNKSALQAARISGLALAIALPLVLLGCATNPASRSETWKCRNDLEVRCADGACEAESEGGFTPMDVHVDDSGAMSICAYSGCWAGSGEVLRGERFLVWIGHGLRFSTSREPESGADILVAIDREDGVGTLKAGEFAHPLLCDHLPTR